MKNSKIAHIIDQLTDREFTLIYNSMCAPMVGGKNHHKMLLGHLHKVKNWAKVNRETIREKLFKDITDVQMRVYISELYKIISTSLVMLHSKSDSRYHDTILLDRFINLDHPKLFENQLAAAQRRLDAMDLRSIDFHEYSYEISHQEYKHISSSNRTQDLNLQELLDGIDILFISKKLQQACFAETHHSVYGQEYDYGLLPEMLTYIEQNDLLKHPSIRLYYCGYQMLSNPKEIAYFDTFIVAIEELNHLFPDIELQSIYRFAINQCIRHLNRGNIEYGLVALDLYKEALDKKYLIVDGHLSRFTYRNIAAIAVKIGEYERAQAYTEEYQGMLKKEEQQSALHFNKALIGYHRKEFAEALQALQIVDFKDHLFNLAAKVIQLKIYYENEDFDLLDSHLDAMQMYLLRKKVIGYHKTNYKNIIKVTRKLLKSNLYDKETRQHLKSEIENVEVLTEKKWILERLNQF